MILFIVRSGIATEVCDDGNGREVKTDQDFKSIVSIPNKEFKFGC